MSYADPPDFVTGSGIALGTLNSYLRDPLLSLRNGNDRMIHLSRAANLSMPTSGKTLVPWTVQDWVIGTASDLHTTASGTKLIAPEPGWWELTGSLILNSASGYRGVGYILNGATAVGYDLALNHAGGAAVARQFFFNESLLMASGEYVEVFGRFQAGTSATVIGGTTGSRLCWRFLGGST